MKKKKKRKSFLVKKPRKSNISQSFEKLYGNYEKSMKMEFGVEEKKKKIED